MSVGRNDPCPCGSGKKYKKCCLPLDRIASRAGAEDQRAVQVRRAARDATEWEADLFAMPGGFEDDPAGRPAALLVVAGGFVLANDVFSSPSPEPEEMAATLAQSLTATAERIGSWPRRVAVREAVVAEALGRRLARQTGGDSVPEVVAGVLAGVDDASASLWQHFTGRRRSIRGSKPRTWAGWGLPGELVADLFRAAADLHRAAPWRELSDADPLGVSVPGGGEWTVCVLGNAGKEYGLQLYSDADDHQAILDDRPWDLWPRGRLISLSFDDGGEIPRPMRKEVARAGWEVAAPDAYPHLLAVNTPAGGIRRRHAADLLAVLRAVPAFLAAVSSAAGGSASLEEWTDPATGVTLSLLPRGPYAHAFRSFASGGPEGPGARPEAAIPEHRILEPEELHGRYEHELAVLDGFFRHLAVDRGFAEATVRKHLQNTRVFLDFLHETGVPWRAVHEYDLREFLHDWYPRKVWDSVGRTEALPVSLKRFFDYLAEEEGVGCPWAARVLEDRETYWRRLETVPGRYFWDEGVGEWRSQLNVELSADLLLPEYELGEDEHWGPTMGIREARLQRELHRRWLLWRDELIRAGTDDRRLVEAELIALQKEWERTPHAAYDGRTPYDVVCEERAERSERGR
jgi:hypothetical protein